MNLLSYSRTPNSSPVTGSSVPVTSRVLFFVSLHVSATTHPGGFSVKRILKWVPVTIVHLFVHLFVSPQIHSFCLFLRTHCVVCMVYRTSSGPPRRENPLGRFSLPHPWQEDLPPPEPSGSAGVVVQPLPPHVAIGSASKTLTYNVDSRPVSGGGTRTGTRPLVTYAGPYGTYPSPDS